MGERFSSKGYNILLTAFSIVIVILLITVFLQSRNIHSLKMDKSNRLVKDQSGINYDNLSKENSTLYESDNIDNEKIKRLESQIDDMQAWQDYLEETLQNEQEPKPTASDVKRNNFNWIYDDPTIQAKIKEQLRASLFQRYKSFFQDNNLPSDIETELIDTLVEKQLFRMKRAPKIYGSWDEILLVDMRQANESVNTKYEKQLTELLSEEEFNSFKDYRKSEPVRRFVEEMKDNGIYKISLDMKQERQLIDAFSDVRMDFLEDQSMKKQVLFAEGPINQEWLKDNLSKKYDITNELNRRYLESARGILTNSQFENFKKFIDLQLEVSQLHKQDGIYISVAPLWGME